MNSKSIDSKSPCEGNNWLKKHQKSMPHDSSCFWQYHEPQAFSTYSESFADDPYLGVDFGLGSVESIPIAARLGIGPSQSANLDHPLVHFVSESGEPYESELPISPPHRKYSTSSGKTSRDDLLNQPSGSTSQAGISRDDDGSWISATGHVGLDPDKRKEFEDQEVPNLKEQENRRWIDSKNIEVEEWSAQCGTSEPCDDPTSCPFLPDDQPASDSSDFISPVDDTDSLHENRLIEGQLYFDCENPHIKSADIDLMKFSRHWNDPPTVPYVMKSISQPSTSNAAIMKFRENADSLSFVSRSATWGTRRQSEPSLADYEGTFLKKLGISNSRETHPRIDSLFDQGKDRLVSIVQRNNSKQSKRARASQHIAEEPDGTSQAGISSLNTHGHPQRPSSRKRQLTPSINAAEFPSATGAIGDGRGSLSSSACTSPKSPGYLGFPKFGTRSRSKSDIAESGRQGLATLWRTYGGPPVAMFQLSTPESKNSEKAQYDQDSDEGNLKNEDQMREPEIIGQSQQTETIIPNFEGFKAHVRRLNPLIDPSNTWLIDRVARQQELRYKNLVELRLRQSKAHLFQIFPGKFHRLSLSSHVATKNNANGHQRNREIQGLQCSPALQLAAGLSTEIPEDEGDLITFPPGVPLPPVRKLDVNFTCHLCFETRKLKKPSDWTMHVHEDLQTFTCTYEDCKSKAFKRKADWVRHENECHLHPEWWCCQVDGCGQKSSRKDNLLQHVSREHKLPLRGQAIRKAFRTEPACAVVSREQALVPEEEPCKFCGKHFAVRKKLRDHLAEHMERISFSVLDIIQEQMAEANTIINPVERIIIPIESTRQTAGSLHTYDSGTQVAHETEWNNRNYLHDYQTIRRPEGSYF